MDDPDNITLTGRKVGSLAPPDAAIGSDVGWRRGILAGRRGLRRRLKGTLGRKPRNHITDEDDGHGERPTFAAAGDRGR